MKRDNSERREAEGRVTSFGFMHPLTSVMLGNQVNGKGLDREMNGVGSLSIGRCHPSSRDQMRPNIT